MFGKPVALFRLLGFEVKADFSWLFLALIIAWSLAQGFFPAHHKGFSALVYWSMGAAGVVGLFFSLVFHELAHSVVARRQGIRMRGITLFIFGGVAEMADEPPHPKAELLMAVAGPIASALLAILFYAASIAGERYGLPEPVWAVASYLALLNGILAAFNVLPAFPLDGGRVLRAVLWRWKRDLHWATRIAAGVGSAAGFALIALGVLNLLTGNIIGGLWWALIGLFLRSAAAGSYQQLLLRRALSGERVRRFMSAQPVTVPPNITVAALVENYVYKLGYDLFPVSENSRLVGCAGTRHIKAIPRDRWEVVTVREVMSPRSADNTIDADQDAMAALALMTQTGNSRLMVTERGHLVGIVALKDMLRFFALKLDLEGSR